MNSEKFIHSTVIKFQDEVEYSDGGIVSKRIIHKDVGNVSLFAFDQGQQLSEHTAPFDALLTVLEGKGEVLIDGKPYHLGAGESIIMPANIPHAVNAVEQFKMLLVLIKG